MDLADFLIEQVGRDQPKTESRGINVILLPTSPSMKGKRTILTDIKTAVTILNHIEANIDHIEPLVLGSKVTPLGPHDPKRMRIGRKALAVASRPQAAESSRGHHHDRNEYDSKRERSHNHHNGNDRKEDTYSGAKHREDRHHKSSPPPSQPETIFPDHYKTLGISTRASADEIKKAARSMRVSSHPDKLKKPGMSESELKDIDERAALVGQAADVLQDRDLKQSYDVKRAVGGF